MSEQNELATITVKLKKTGDLTIDDEGAPVVIGHYNRLSGHLEYTTREYSVKLHQQVTSVIGTVNKGKDVSGLEIKSIGIKGEARTDTKKLPKRPKAGPGGDTEYAQAAWYIENDLPQAIIRYGIYCDANGQPVRKNARRVIEETQDLRASHEDADLENVKDGPKTVSKAPVRRTHRIIEGKKVIIARRATQEGPDGETPMTFTQHEVVGGFQPDEEFDTAMADASQEGGEA